jgi:hypothetical protein
MTASTLARAAVLIALIADGSAKADSTTDAVKRWGLIGTWAVDCGKPAARGNTYLSYAIEPDGIAVHSRDFGDGKDSQEILAAEVTADGQLTLRIRFPQLGETREFSLLKGTDGRYRTMSNHDTKGGYSIRDGKFTFNGNRTPWLTRCK